MRGVDLDRLREEGLEAAPRRGAAARDDRRGVRRVLRVAGVHRAEPVAPRSLEGVAVAQLEVLQDVGLPRGGADGDQARLGLRLRFERRDRFAVLLRDLRRRARLAEGVALGRERRFRQLGGRRLRQFQLQEVHGAGDDEVVGAEGADPVARAPGVAERRDAEPQVQGVLLPAGRPGFVGAAEGRQQVEPGLQPGDDAAGAQRPAGLRLDGFARGGGVDQPAAVAKEAQVGEVAPRDFEDDAPRLVDLEPPGALFEILKGGAQRVCPRRAAGAAARSASRNGRISRRTSPAARSAPSVTSR